MCTLTQSYGTPENCKAQGGVRRVFLTTKDNFLAAIWTAGAFNSASRGQFTTVAGIPANSWIEMSLDAGQQNSIETDGSDGRTHTVTATLVRRGLNVVNMLAGNDLQKCCDLVMAADYGGYMVLYGVNLYDETLEYNIFGGLELGYQTTTGNNATEVALFTYNITTPENSGTNVAFIPVATTVATAIKAAVAP